MSKHVTEVSRNIRIAELGGTFKREPGDDQRRLRRRWEIKHGQLGLVFCLSQANA
jgi:hypothetical protein